MAGQFANLQVVTSGSAGHIMTAFRCVFALHFTHYTLPLVNKWAGVGFETASVVFGAIKC